MLIPMSLMDTLATLANTVMTPVYWLISGMMVLFHFLLTPLFGSTNGWTWVLTIVLMTCVLRLAMLPLYKKQMNASRAMTSVQPKMKELQEKYKGDRERLSRETMKLYEENGVSPYASCLPMLVQMPIFMGLYWVIRGAAYYCPTAEGCGKYTGPNLKGYWMANRVDLAESLRDSTVFGARLSGMLRTVDGGWNWNATGYLAIILVIIMMAVLFIQQWQMMHKNMPPAAMSGPMGQTQKMMYAMPLMYVFIGANISIGVLFYWVVSNTWTWLQQVWIIRHYPTPETPAYVEWEERMIAKGKDPKLIEADRIAAGKSKRKGPSAAAKMMAAADRRQAEAAGTTTTPTELTPESIGTVVSPKAKTGGSPGAAPARPTAAVIRTDEATGKQVVVRTQPVNVSRAKRKK